MMRSKLFLSHRMDLLADRLSQELEQNGSPFHERWVLLPSQSCKHWLSLELAKYKGIMDLSLMSWREGVLRLARTAAKIPDRWELQFALADLMNDPACTPEPLRYLAEKGQIHIARLTAQWAGQLSETGFYGQAEPWQSELWGHLQARYGWKLPAEVLPTLSRPERLAGLHCFCLDDLPPLVLQMLLRMQATHYSFSPCKMFWEDLCSDRERSSLLKRSPSEPLEELLRDTHPLLANWGRLGRAALKAFDGLDAIECYGENDEQGELCLLQMLQRDLLSLRTIGDGPLPGKNDRSIQLIGAGASLLREVQILKDEVLFEIERGTLPSEMLVLAPDIRAYESLIRFVFGAEIPIRISVTSGLSNNRLLQGMLLLFSLSEGRWDADAVMELFENGAFRSKQNLTEEELHSIRLWIEEAKIRTGELDWEEGIDRMARGLVFLLPKEEGPPRVSSIDWGLSELLGRFLTLLNEVRAQVRRFRGKLSLPQWKEQLVCASKLFDADERETAVFEEMAAQIPALDISVDFIHVRTAIEEACKFAIDAYQPNLLEAVEFTSLQLGALRPVKTLFLLGLDSESYPRKKIVRTLDWKPMPDDASRDRYLMLQALFAARERLWISYRHLSPDDGKTCESSLVVQELRQTLESFYEGVNVSPLCHPTLPFDKRYARGELRTYSAEPFRAVVSSRRTAPSWPEERISTALSDLMQCARAPWRALLRRRGIYLKEEELFAEQRLEEASLPVYVKRRLLHLALKEPIEEVLSQCAHELPRGALGAVAKSKLIQEANKQRHFFEKWGVDPAALQPLEGTELEMAGNALIVPDGNDFSGWVRNSPAILTALQRRGPRIDYCSLKSGTKKTFEGIDASSALEKWLEYYARAMRSFSPLVKGAEKYWVERKKEAWMEKLREESQDPVIRFVMSRSFDLELLWQEWEGVLPDLFSELYTERDSKVDL